MKKLFVSILLLVLSLTSHAAPFDGWTDEEKSLLVAMELAILADYKTTSSLFPNNKNISETNIFLGEQPKQDKINAWLVVISLGHYFAADHLNHTDRKSLLWIITILETGAAANNISLGATIKF